MLSAASAKAQVLIGENETGEPHAGAILDLQGQGTKGLLLPNVALLDVSEFQLLVDEPDLASAKGMMIYNTFDETKNGQGHGVYVWDGAKWLFAAISGGAAVPVTTITVSTAGNVTGITSGASLQFSASVTPGNATNKTITWSVVSGPGSGSIDQSGFFTGSNVGTVTICATANDGSGVLGVKEITVNTGPGTVTGNNGTYKTWCFNGGIPGNICWMTDNSKEGTSSATSYNNGQYSERGYYYTWAQVSKACPSGWTPPVRAHWDALAYYINGSTDPDFVDAWTNSALAGRYNPSSGPWVYWDVQLYAWNWENENEYMATSSAGHVLFRGGSCGTCFMSVRCIKVN